MGESPFVNYINELLANNRVVIFSKTWCPYCYKAKDLFKDLLVNYHEVVLDTMGEKGCKVQEALEEMTQQKTVPNIFINSNHIGGYTNLYQAQQTGRLCDIFAGVAGSYNYDLIIIGGGSGGLAAAQEAAALGKNVAICDFVKPSPRGTKWDIGGTCVNVGCVPKKLMHRASLIGHDMRDAPFFGWDAPPAGHRWETLVENVQNHIKSINWMYRKDLKKQGITYYNGFAKFVDRHTIVTETEKKNEKITGETIIVATGGRPNYDDIPGALENAITSDDLFTLPNEPKNTLVIGGGYIALESAGFLQELGSQCTVLVRSILLRGFDQQMAGKIEEQMTESGVKFVKQCVVLKISQDGGGEGGQIRVEGQYEDGTPYSDSFNTVLLAIGRTPNTSGLGLENAGVKLHESTAKIIVDDYDRTNIPNIYAVGDVAFGRPELTPVAIQAGKLLVRRLYTFSTLHPSYRFVPTTVFTPLEYGCVGDSEERAIETYGENNIEVFHSSFSPLESSLAHRFDWRCYAKMVCIKEEGRMKVTGLHILGPNAGEVTQGFALALKLGAYKEDFDLLFAIHPTNAQIFTKFQVTKSSGEDADVHRCCS
uniref:thioredoxin-disulfide reductase (NADPH) n=1 Tax=Panstrongylus lignarius TaxID=156445 RepID=A0A224XM35_9HEMI